jgi:hypothetical protein
MYLSEREDRRGKPITMPSRKRGLNYSIYLDEDQIKVLDDIRWRERKSLSAIMRRAVEEYINNHAEGNDCFTLDKWQNDPNFKAVPTLMSDKEKWNNYIDSCSDQECTDIAIMANYIHTVVGMRRSREYKERQQQTKFGKYG